MVDERVEPLPQLLQLAGVVLPLRHRLPDALDQGAGARGEGFGDCPPTRPDRKGADRATARDPGTVRLCDEVIPPDLAAELDGPTWFKRTGDLSVVVPSPAYPDPSRTLPADFYEQIRSGGGFDVAGFIRFIREGFSS